MASGRTPYVFPRFTNVEDERRHRKPRLAVAFRLFGHFGADRPEQAKRTAALVGPPMAGWRVFQPLCDWIVERQPDLLEE